jgi:hypothetical protein
MDVTVGTTFATVTFTALDDPPAGGGLNTVKATTPPLVRSLAGMDTVSWLELTNVVGRLEPFHCTEEFRMKLLP